MLTAARFAKPLLNLLKIKHSGFRRPKKSESTHSRLPEAPLDERQAVERLKRGDIAGLALLVKRYQQQAVYTAYLITHDPALAEDVVQDVFLQLTRYIASFDASRSFGPWLMRSVVHAAARAARRSQHDLPLDDPVEGSSFAELLHDPAPNPADLVEMAAIEQALEQALLKLTPEQRAVIVMRYYLDLSDEEISQALNCATGTVRWRLHTARRQLRALLHHWG